MTSDKHELYEDERSKARERIAKIDAKLFEAYRSVQNAKSIGALATLTPGTLELARQYENEVRKAVRASAPHRKGCRCVRCDTEPAHCTVCDPPRTFKNRTLLRSHAARTHVGKVAKARRRLTPTAQGYLLKVTANHAESAKLNFGAMTKFQSAVMGGFDVSKPAGKRVGLRFVRQHKRLAAEIAQLVKSDPHVLLALPHGRAPATVVHLIYELAIITRTAPSSVLAALLCYGLDTLAKELRESKQAPTPIVPVPKKEEQHASESVSSVQPAKPPRKSAIVLPTAGE